MKKAGIIIASLLICSISYAGYVTIEKEKIAIGDGTKVIGELPMQKRVEVVGETTNRYIIKHNSHLAGIDKKCLRFPKDEQPYIRPYVGMSEQIYEVTLELYKGEEYKVIKEDKTRYLIECTFKDIPMETWVEKNLVYYNASSKLDGLVKHQGRWITPEEKFELEQETKGLVKYENKWLTYDQVQEAKGLVKYQDKWVTPDDKFELEQKAKGLIKYEGKWMTYEEVQEAKGLVIYEYDWVTLEEKFELEQKAKGLTKYGDKWLTYEQIQEAKGLVKYQDMWVTPDEKFELEQEAKRLIKYEGKWLTYDQVQEAKGLVKYQDKWVTPDKKFELEQEAKGLTKYEDKWLTYEQIQEAKGLVKYQDMWITSKERLERKWKNILLNIREFAMYYAKPILSIIFVWGGILFIVYLKQKRIMNKIKHRVRFLMCFLMLNKSKKQKIIILIICISFSVVGMFFVLTKVRERTYEKKFRSVVAALIMSKASALSILEGISDVWSWAIKHNLNFNNQIEEYIESHSRDLIYLANDRERLEESMNYLKNYPKKYREAFNILMEIYGVYSQICELALNPSGTLLSFNIKINDLKSEFTDIESRLIVYLPNFDVLKEFVKEFWKKSLEAHSNYSKR